MRKEKWSLSNVREWRDFIKYVTGGKKEVEYRSGAAACPSVEADGALFPVYRMEVRLQHGFVNVVVVPIWGGGVRTAEIAVKVTYYEYSVASALEFSDV